jgi:hypothetical protein
MRAIMDRLDEIERDYALAPEVRASRRRPVSWRASAG